MPDTSARLGLPYLMPAQAQKHVTHNEALVRLDLLTQLVLEARGAETPPASPADGEIHALGAAPVEAWAGLQLPTNTQVPCDASALDEIGET